MAKKRSKKSKGGGSKKQPVAKKKNAPKEQKKSGADRHVPVKTIETFLQSSRTTWLLLIGLLLLVGTFILWDYLTFQYVLLFKDKTSSDTVNIFYPQSYHAINYIWTEGIPKWSFNAGLGVNLYPAGLSFNPISWVNILLGSEGLAYRIAYNQLFHVIITGILFYFFLRVTGVSSYISIVGSLLMAYSGYAMIGVTWYGHLSGILYAVFLLVAFEYLFSKNKWWLFPFPFLFMINTKLYFNGVFLLLYFLFRYFSTYSWQPKRFLTYTLKMGGLGILGIMLSAPFWGATAYKFLNSARVVGEATRINELRSRSLFYMEDASHYVTAILRLFSNDLLGTAHDFKGWYNYLEAPIFYCGLITLLLVPQIFIFLSKRLKLIYGAFLGFWILLVAIPYFRYSFYLFAGDFYKHALSFFIPFTLLFFGLQALSYVNDQKRQIHSTLLLATLVVLLALLFYPYASVEGVIDSSLRLFIALMLVVYTLLLLVWQMPAYRLYAQIGLIVLITFEVAWMGNISVNNREPFTGKEFSGHNGYSDSTLEALDFLNSADTSFYRVTKFYSSSPSAAYGLNDAMVQDYYSSTIYRSQNNSNYIRFLKEVDAIPKIDKDFSKWVGGLSVNVILQGFGSIKYMLRKEDDKDYPEKFYAPLRDFSDVKLYRNSCYIPFGFCYDRYFSLDDLRALPNLNEKARSLFHGVVLNEETLQKSKGLKALDIQSLPSMTRQAIWDEAARRSANALNVTHQSQNQIVGNISLTSPQLMFFSIPYHRGWSAKVNGQRAELLKVNIGFMGLMLDPGEHHIELSYTPVFYYEGWCIFLLGLLIFGLLLRFTRKGVSE